MRLALTGFAPTASVSGSTAFAPATASLVLGSKAAASIIKIAGNLDPAVLTLTGIAPSISIAAAGITKSPSAASLSLSADACTAYLARVVGPGPADLQLIGFSPSTSAPIIKEVEESRPVITGKAPSLILPITVSPATASLSVAGAAPIVRPACKYALPDEGRLAFFAKTPAKNLPQFQGPSVASLTLTAFAPNASIGALTETPSTARLTVTGKTPTTDQDVVTFGAKAELILTGKAPGTVNTGLDVSITTGKGTLSIIAKAPTFANVPVWTDQGEADDIWTIQSEDTETWSDAA